MESSQLEAVRHELSQELRGKSVLVTGSTGFVGTALIREGIYLNDNLGAEIRFNLVVRPSGTPLPIEWLDREDLTFIESSIGTPIHCPTKLDLVFHCATPASALLNSESPIEMFKTNVEAMQWLLSGLKSQQEIVRVVFASSGAVYGALPEYLASFPENFNGGPNVLEKNSAYAEGKRVAEFLLAQAGYGSQIEPVVARMFAFSGIGLPLDRHFAIGNFVHDAINRDSIVVRGSGVDIRSYLDSLDMAVWLWAAAIRAKNFSPIHIGSERAISIAQLAQLVSQRTQVLLGKKTTIEIQHTRSAIDGATIYVPSTARTRSSLGVAEFTPLEVSIDQMIQSAIKI